MNEYCEECGELAETAYYCSPWSGKPEPGKVWCADCHDAISQVWLGDDISGRIVSDAS